jgi:hypothetical protein
MIRGGSNGLRAHFTRATISTRRLPQREQASRLAPIEGRRFNAITSSHLGGIGLDLMLAFLAPHDQPDACSGGATQRHRRAGLGFSFTPIAVLDTRGQIQIAQERRW